MTRNLMNTAENEKQDESLEMDDDPGKNSNRDDTCELMNTSALCDQLHMPLYLIAQGLEKVAKDGLVGVSLHEISGCESKLRSIVESSANQ